MHTELLPGHDGQDCGLSGNKCMTCSTVDVFTKGVQGWKLVFAMSTYGTTFERVSDGLEHVFKQTRYLVLLSKMLLEHEQTVDGTRDRPRRPGAPVGSAGHIHSWHMLGIQG